MAHRKHLMVVDDDKSFRRYLRTLLQSMDHQVTCFASGEEAIQALEEGFKPSLVILDFIMEGMTGIETLRLIHKIDESIPVIMLTGVDQTQTIVETMQTGASDYLIKPFEPEEIELALCNVFEKADLVDEIKRLRKLLKKDEEEPSIIYSSKMQEIDEIIHQVADTNVTVLIHGESGVGKEVVAKRLHGLSSRANYPFVKVNCAALPPDLLESELFGYEKGAFTGAAKSKPGKFELAQNGTIFLDEIGEMDLGLQSKLLQVLQDNEFSRLGGQKTIHVQVRVIVATNKNLESMVELQQFREDLYYRLNVINILIPPLRERKEEIPVFCDAFLKKYARHFNKKISRLPESLMNSFIRHDWKGNVRELENMIKRYVVLRDEKGILNELASGFNLPSAKELVDNYFSELPENYLPISLKELDKQVAQLAEGALISNVLQHTHGNKRKAADILQISYKALLYKIKECGI